MRFNGPGIAPANSLQTAFLTFLMALSRRSRIVHLHKARGQLNETTALSTGTQEQSGCSSKE